MEPSWHMDRSIPVTETGCWLWLGCCDQKGYGLVSLNRVTKRAHRVSYEAATGIAPGDLQVLHKCDTPCCINPDHLFLGTNQDNVADKVAKGRQASGDVVAMGMRGERQGSRKLCEQSVREILRSSERGVDLALRFGISQSVVSEIRSRKAWRHVKEIAA